MAEKQTDNRYEVEKKLTELSRLSDEEILHLLDTDPEGINQVEASARLEEYGKNIIDSGNENNLLERVKEAIINPFNVVLLGVAGITLVTDVIIAEKPSWSTFLMLVAVILISGIISFVQTEKSNNAAQKLQKMISNRIDVIRNDILMDVDISEIVPGDIGRMRSCGPRPDLDR